MIPSNGKFLVVGFGIAGLAMCRQLEKAGMDFLCFDDLEKKATTVSAGLINPITGRKYQMSWMYHEMEEHFIPFYDQISKILGIPIIKDATIEMPMYGAEHINDFSAACISENGHYLSIKKNEKLYSQDYKTLGLIHKVSVVNTQDLIFGMRSYYESLGRIIGEKFDLNKLEFSDEYLVYQGEIYKAIIFCEGNKVVKNPLWKGLKLVLAKGEALILEINGYSENRILKEGLKIIPIGENKYWVGSNFEWDFSDDFPSQTMFEYFSEQVALMLGEGKYKIIDHVAGIRPAASDRKPIIGKHPKYSNAFILNGLGTKGCSLAPWASSKLLNFIQNPSKELIKEVDVQRYAKYMTY